eukprot:COSAG01_NODE_4022_length_5426_cov_112.261310_4_plen_189_part_00
MTGQSLDSKLAATQGGAVRKRAQRQRPLGRRPDPLSEKHLKAQRHGWAIVEEYQRCCEEDEELARMCGEHDFLLDDADSPASVRQICGTFSKQGINLGKTFVADTLNRWRENGDPTETQSGGEADSTSIGRRRFTEQVSRSGNQLGPGLGRLAVLALTNTGEGWVGCLLQRGSSTPPGTLLLPGLRSL